MARTCMYGIFGSVWTFERGWVCLSRVRFFNLQLFLDTGTRVSMGASQELIDSHVSVKQLKLAVEALHKHETARQNKRQQNELLPDKELHIWLVAAVKKSSAEHKLKPFKMCAIAIYLIDSSA